MSAGLRFDRLAGREVRTANGRRLGRLQECRVELRDGEWRVVEYVLGTAGLLERLGLGLRLVLGITARSGWIVRWNQLDLSDPDRPRLTCPVEDLPRR